MYEKLLGLDSNAGVTTVANKLGHANFAGYVGKDSTECCRDDVFL